MYYNADGSQAFADEIELLIEEIAREKFYETQTNQDSSKFWITVADTISGYPLGGFHAGYEELRKSMLYQGPDSRELFDYAICFSMRMRSKPFASKALETCLSQVATIQTDSEFSEVLDREYSGLDPLGELMLFFKIFGRAIERRLVEIAGGQIRLPSIPAKES